MNKFINLFDPSTEDIEQYKKLGFNIPTREELSNLDFFIYRNKNNNIILTIPIRISEISSNYSLTVHEICFLVCEKTCIIIRYDDFFDIDDVCVDLCNNGIEVYLELQKLILDRIRNSLSNTTQIKLMYLSNKIFNYDLTDDNDHRKFLKSLGKLSDYIDNTNQLSLKLKKSLDCITSSYGKNISPLSVENIIIYKTDLEAILDTIQMYSTKIGFLLDSTLGFINIDQNNTMKMLTIVSSVLIAPTLIAGIFGMNFSSIPGANSHYGFIICVMSMLVMIVIPLIIFWYKGWFKFQ